MQLLLELVLVILQIAQYLLFAAVIFSWLVTLDVVNRRNKVVWQIGDFLYRITEPVLRPLRRVLPNLGGLDLSPLVALLIIWVIQRAIQLYGGALLFG
jgi:YggT family protein